MQVMAKKKKDLERMRVRWEVKYRGVTEHIYFVHLSDLATVPVPQDNTFGICIMHNT